MVMMTTFGDDATVAVAYVRPSALWKNRTEYPHHRPVEVAIRPILVAEVKASGEA